MFKQSFKYYKRKTPVPDLQDVVDFDSYEERKTSYSWHNLVKPENVSEICNSPGVALPVGLHPVHMWRCYTLLNHPGLLVIRNAFTLEGQRYWIARCLRDYPRPPNISNLDANNFPIGVLSNWWEELQKCRDVNSMQRIKAAMRWTTLGYHHNWNTKVYNESMHSAFPTDLSSMCQYFSLCLGYSQYTPQAAIVNYYPIGTNLSGHTDHSELNLEAPLFSFSFGQTAIFLIGGMTIEEQPTALYLRSGDVIIMSKESRLCYHAVPRIIKEDSEPWNSISKTCTKNPGEILDTSTDNGSMDLLLYSQLKDEDFWIPFDRYVNDSRININVRQVLPVGVSQLPTIEYDLS